MRKHFVFVASALACCALLAAGADGAQRRAGKDKDAVKLRARGRTLVLTAGGRTRVLNVADEIGAARLEGAGVVFVTRRADFTYLVVDACGPSKPKADARHCGLGTECNLLWLKLTPDWRVAESRSALYASCWLSVSNEPLETRGRRLSIEYEDYHRELKVRLTYDADQPERGFVLKESPLQPGARR